MSPQHERLIRARQQLESKLLNRVGFEAYDALRDQLRELDRVISEITGSQRSHPEPSVPDLNHPDNADFCFPAAYQAPKRGALLQRIAAL